MTKQEQAIYDAMELTVAYMAAVGEDGQFDQKQALRLFHAMNDWQDKYAELLDELEQHPR